MQGHAKVETFDYIGDDPATAPALAAELKLDAFLIEGCTSNLWLVPSLEAGRCRFRCDADSLITKGMIALFVHVLDDETPDAILTADMSFVDRTGLKEHLAPTRANALNLMATQMKQRALSFAS